MDLVRGIFKQKIAAFLFFGGLYFEVFPEYILDPPPLQFHPPFRQPSWKWGGGGGGGGGWDGGGIL